MVRLWVRIFLGPSLGPRLIVSVGRKVGLNPGPSVGRSALPSSDLGTRLKMSLRKQKNPADIRGAFGNRTLSDLSGFFPDVSVLFSEKIHSDRSEYCCRTHPRLRSFQSFHALYAADEQTKASLTC
jgi:hypothetical protein